MSINTRHERDFVCDEYEKYFYETVINKPGFIQNVLQLVELLVDHGKLRLFCWCSPERCHGQTLKRYIIDNYKILKNL